MLWKVVQCYYAYQSINNREAAYTKSDQQLTIKTGNEGKSTVKKYIGD